MVASPHVLVIDDETEILNVLIEVLEDEGFNVMALHGATTALDAVRRAQPALILVDYSMPEMTGAELIMQLHTHGFLHIPVTIMSASTRADVLNVPGATNFIAKPFDIDALVQHVRRYVAA